MRLSSRQGQILGAVQDGEYVEVKDLAERLGVDASTIRRDIQVLVRNGLVTRLHGGIRLPVEVPKTTNEPPSEDLLEIAETARHLLREGDSVMLTSGPCTDLLIPLLLDLEDLTVITNDLRTSVFLSYHPHIRVLAAGGELRDAPHSAATSGSYTAAYLEAQQADWVFLEVDGIHHFAGLTTAAAWQVSARRAMFNAADRRCVLAPLKVFGERSAGFIAEVGQADLIIAGDAFPDADLPAFGGKIVRANATRTDLGPLRHQIRL